MVATVVTHRRPEETWPGVRQLIEVAQAAGGRLVFDPLEAEKHGLQSGEGVESADEPWTWTSASRWAATGRS